MDLTKPISHFDYKKTPSFLPPMPIIAIAITPSFIEPGSPPRVVDLPPIQNLGAVGSLIAPQPWNGNGSGEQIIALDFGVGALGNVAHFSGDKLMTLGTVSASIGLITVVTGGVVEPVWGSVAGCVIQVLWTTTGLADNTTLGVDNHPFSEGTWTPFVEIIASSLCRIIYQVSLLMDAVRLVLRHEV